MYKIIFYCFLQIASIKANCGWKDTAYSSVLLDFIKIDEEDTKKFQGIQITSNDLDIKDHLFNDKCNIIEGSNIKFTLNLTEDVSSEKITEIFTVTYTKPTALNLTVENILEPCKLYTDITFVASVNGIEIGGLGLRTDSDPSRSITAGPGLVENIKVDKIGSTTAEATWSLYTSQTCADNFEDKFKGFRIKINNEVFMPMLGATLSSKYTHYLNNMESCAVQELSISPLFGEANTYPGIETSEK